LVIWHDVILPFCGILLYLFVAFCFTFLWHFALPFCGKHYFAEEHIKQNHHPDLGQWSMGIIDMRERIS